MSNLGCKCGYIIGDQTDNIPYKGHMLPDVRTETFFVWLMEETQSYVEAAQAGRVEQWLLERGYGRTMSTSSSATATCCTITSTRNSAS
jgi:hypothetical protein